MNPVNHAPQEQYLFTKSEVEQIVRDVLKESFTISVEQKGSQFSSFNSMILKVDDEDISESYL